MRLEGASYEEIARAGGGIVSSVRATRAADEATLLAAALPRVDALLAEGVTTLEIKSGYGLDLESERKMLRVARAIGAARPVQVVTSWLAAHALPPEYRDDRDGYHPRRGDRRHGRRPWRRTGRRGRRLLRGHRLQPRRDRAGLRPRGEARPPGQAARRAALRPRRRGARGASRRAVGRPSGMARRRTASTPWPQSGTVAVLLPGAFYTLRETKAAAGPGLARRRRADRAGDRLQPRHLAADLDAPDHEHGRDAVPPDAGRVPGRRHPQRRPRPRPRTTAARSPPASAPTWRSGTSASRPNSPIASASTRFMPASSEANLSELVLTPGRTTLAELEAVWRGGLAVRLAESARGRRLRPPPPASTRPPAATSRSMASTPASASSPRSRSRPRTPRRSSAT